MGRTRPAPRDGRHRRRTRRLHYVEPDKPATADGSPSCRLGPTLVIIDAAAGAYAAPGLDDNSARMPSRSQPCTSARSGSPTSPRSSIDHVVKNAEPRQVAIGSERKPAEPTSTSASNDRHRSNRGGTGHASRSPRSKRPSRAPQAAATSRRPRDPQRPNHRTRSRWDVHSRRHQRRRDREEVAPDALHGARLPARRAVPGRTQSHRRLPRRGRQARTTGRGRQLPPSRTDISATTEPISPSSTPIGRRAPFPAVPCRFPTLTLTLVPRGSLVPKPFPARSLTPFPPRFPRFPPSRGNGNRTQREESKPPRPARQAPR